MKRLVFLSLILSPIFALGADCLDYPKRIDSERVYAEVFSRSHMDLEFVAVLKASDFLQLKIIEGAPETLPGCVGKAAKVERLGANLVQKWVSGGSLAFTAAYRVCIYDRFDHLIESHVVCNREVGD